MPKMITIERLAEMVQAGFAECYERLASKEDLNELRARVEMIQSNMATKEDLKILRFELKEDIYDVEDRVFNRYGNRIDKLETDMKKVKAKLKLT